MSLQLKPRNRKVTPHDVGKYFPSNPQPTIFLDEQDLGLPETRKRTRKKRKILGQKLTNLKRNVACKCDIKYHPLVNISNLKFTSSPEYNIFLRPQNGTDAEWVPVGSMVWNSTAFVEYDIEIVDFI